MIFSQDYDELYWDYEQSLKKIAEFEAKITDLEAQLHKKCQCKPYSELKKESEGL